MQKSAQNEALIHSGNDGGRTRGIHKIVLTAAFVALSTVANAFITVRIGTLFKFSPVLAIYFFAGYYLGAPLGFCVGAIGDFLGWVLFTDGLYNPIIGLSNALCCALPALFFGFRRPFGKPFSFGGFAWRSGVGFFVCYVLCTVLLTSTGIWLYTAFIQSKYQTLLAWYVYRAGAQVVNNVSNYLITLGLFFPLRQVGLLEGFVNRGFVGNSRSDGDV